jgi:receptor expression-enhancing protein 5/6
MESITGMPQLYIAGGFAASFVIVCWVGLGAAFFAHMISLLYPAYRSFKAISRLQVLGDLEERDHEQELVVLGKVKKYLMYWVVYGCFNVVEYVSGVFLFFLPFYWPLKMLFLLWCVHPSTMGSVWVYERVVMPILRKHEVYLDRNLSLLSHATNRTYDEMRGDAGGLLAHSWDTIIRAALDFKDSLLKQEERPPARAKFEP